MKPSTKFQLFTWTLAVLSLVGVVINVWKWKECFYIWTVTNALWAIVDYKKGIHGQAALHAIYFVLAIYGILAW